MNFPLIVVDSAGWVYKGPGATEPQGLQPVQKGVLGKVTHF